MRIRNLFDPGSAKEKIRIRDKHPGSATLVDGQENGEKSGLNRQSNTGTTFNYFSNYLETSAYQIFKFIVHRYP